MTLSAVLPQGNCGSQIKAIWDRLTEDVCKTRLHLAQADFLFMQYWGLNPELPNESEQALQN